mmetsp:Transcript_6354/g.7993  ORF Transcript_6354/g.7993 Transcript_6354/m.7993 type:complete len:654 (-) Transcript_6354:121-2082(-)
MTSSIHRLNKSCNDERPLCQFPHPSTLAHQSLEENDSPLPPPPDTDEMSGVHSPISNFPSRTMFYLSLSFLVIATTTNSSVHGVLNIQPSSPRLGAAAISSLTEALSPILPFTGGSDLRRVGERSLRRLLPTGSFNSWEGFLFYNGATVTSAKRLILGMSRGGGDGPSDTGSGLTLSDRIAIRKKFESKPTILGSSNVFLPLKTIGEMTLQDVSDLFRYAIGNHREGFDNKSFLSQVSPLMARIATQMDGAVAKARGSGVKPANTIRPNGKSGSAISSLGYGDIDALQFLAAMRIFAEWRVLRQVPEGFKGYAVGMGLGLKDVVQNIAKTEAAIGGYIEEQRQSLSLKSDNCTEHEKDKLRSPTLRDILLSEVSLSLHSLPRLKEKSAAMGLLWVRRQLQYQTAIFSNTFKQSYDSVQLAVAAAYEEVYGAYHGWAVQKIFNYSFKAAPPVELIYQTMNPGYYQVALDKASKIKGNVASTHEFTEYDHDDDQSINSKNPFAKLGGHIAKEWVSIGRHVHSEWDKLAHNVQNTFTDIETLSKYMLSNEWEKVGRHIHDEWDKLGHHIQGEWIKLSGNTLKLFRHNNKVRNVKMRGGSGRQNVGLQGDELMAFVNNEMESKALKQIEIYLHVAKPLLDDLAGLFEEMNMNDPTKV